MLKLATILDNPGEPKSESQYRDPRALAELGYNGVVIYQTTGLSGVESPAAIDSGEMRRWVEGQFEQVSREIDRALGAGLAVYIAYDVLCLARSVLERDAPTLTCRNRPRTICPGSEPALSRSVRALEAALQRWPRLAGVVLRFGDNDAARLPYLVGNDIYSPHCPRCSDLDRAARVLAVLDRFHELVVRRQGKRLIARAWNLRPGGMHDTPAICEQVRDRLPGEPGDDRFVLSFKFSETDFWRYQRWNPASLCLGGRPILYELQCQREFEGKGGIPNWQVPLWRDGFVEMGDADRGGLARVSRKVNLAGLWAWVRGGGWGGPFVKNEAWIDANVVAVPRLADDPAIEPEALAQLWVRERLQVEDADAAQAVLATLTRSVDFIRQAFYVEPYARARRDHWHSNGDWVQDDLLDADAAWRVIQRIDEAQLDRVIAEKEAAIEAVARCRRDIESTLRSTNRAALEPLTNSLLYAHSLFTAVGELLAGLAYYRRHQASPSPTLADHCRRRLYNAQSFWNHHTQRHGSLAGCATSFRESGFWELTQRILSEIET